MYPFLSRHKRTFFALIAAFFYAAAISYATPPVSPYTPAETLDPSCAPGDTNCSVLIYPDQTGNTGEFLTTDGTTVSWATIPASSNIYNTDGSLTGNRTLTLSGNTLDIVGTTTTRFYSSGGMAIGGDVFTDGTIYFNQNNDQLRFGGSVQIGQSLGFNKTFSNATSVVIGSQTTAGQINDGNVLIGYDAGKNLGSTNTGEAALNIIIGREAAANTITTGVKNIIIGTYQGSSLWFPMATNSSYKLLIGNINGGGGGTLLSGDMLQGNLWVNPTTTNFTSPDPSVAFGINPVVSGIGSSTTYKGFLPPKMLATNRTGITSPAVGLQVFQTDTSEGQYVNLSGGWQRFLTTSDGAAYFAQNGNSFGTTATLGTNDTQPLVFETAGIERARISSGGNMLLNAITDDGYKLDVNGTVRLQGNVTLPNAGQTITLLGSSFYSSDANNLQITYPHYFRMIKTAGGDPGEMFGINWDGTRSVIALARTTIIADQTSGSLPGSPAGILDIRSTTKGVLLPRMTSAQRTTIATPATGLQVYQTDTTEGQYVNLSGGWQRFLTTADIGTTITSDNIYNANGSLTGARTLTLSGNTLDIVGTTTTRFAANGDVGIGTTSPSARLDVRVNSAIDGQYNLANFQRTGGSLGSQYISIGDDTYAGTVLGQNGGNGGAYQYGSYLDTFLVNKYTAGNLGSLLLGTNNIVRMTITHNGNVGIGTQSPGALFGIAGDSVDFLRFDYGASASAYNLKLTQIVEPADVYWSFVQRNVNTDYNVLAFRQGNVGIGTTANSGFKFDVNGTGRFLDDITIGGDGNKLLFSNSNNQVIIGTASTALSTAFGDIAIGFDAQTSSVNGGIAIGASARAMEKGTAFGVGAWANSGIAIGARSVAESGEFVIGNSFDTRDITNIYFGSGKQRGYSNGTSLVYVDGVGTSYTLNGSGARGTDFAGGSITIAGGKGTGAGTPGNIIFATATAGGSGSTLQTLTERARFAATGNFLLGTATDAGYKLDVNGAARVTTDNPIRFDPATNQYGLAIQPGSAGPSRLYATTNGGVSPLQAFEFGFFTTSLNSSSGFSDPSGNNVSFRLYGTHVAGGAGGGTYTDFLINPTINMAGNANPGVYRGINFQPTLTDITNTTIFAFRNTIGNNVFNTTSGNTLIGTETDNGFKLQVNGTARIYNELSAWGGGFRLNRNGAEPYFAFHYNESQVAQIRSMADGTLRFTDGGGGTSRIEISPSTFKSFTSLTAAKTNLGGGGAGTPSVGIYHGTAFTPDGYFSTLFLRNTNGVEMTDGFGVGVDFQIEDPTQGPIAVGSVGAVRMGADNSGALIFRTTNAGSLLEKARVTNDGNLLVGTATNSGFKLDVAGTGRFTSDVTIGSSTSVQLNIRDNSDTLRYTIGRSTGTGALTFTGSQSGFSAYSFITTGGSFSIGNNGDIAASNLILTASNSSVSFASGSATLSRSASNGSINLALQNFANASFNIAGAHASSDVVVISGATSGAQLRVLYDGSNNAALSVGTTGNTTLALTGTAPSFSITNLTVAGSSQDALCIVNGGTEVQRNNGAQTCTVSSARFKHDINPLSGDILNTLSQFTPSTFIYNDQTNLRIGLIAEQVATIDPRLVFYEEDGITPRGVRYEDLSVMTLKGVQEIIITTTTLTDLTKENSLRAQLSSWLGDIANGLETIAAGRIRARQEVCIDDVCINKEQLRQLIQTQTAQPPQQETPPTPSTPEEEIGLQETIDTQVEIGETAPLEAESAPSEDLSVPAE